MIPARALSSTQFIAKKKFSNGKTAILWRHADYQYEIEIFANETINGVVQQVLQDRKFVNREYYDALSFLNEFSK